jgi:hypothetical protein
VRGSTFGQFNNAPRRRFIVRHRGYDSRHQAELLDRAADFRKHSVRVRPDEPDRTHDDYQNHRQHHSIFGNILALLIVPKLLYEFIHRAPLSCLCC